uniref:Tetraspanin n=1 Tax=Schistosoma mansoni TaxID=6183 RepID=A0A5K4F3E4_SCHMA
MCSKRSDVCQYRCLKTFLIVSNSLNLVFGICLIVMGSYVHLFLSTFLRNLPVHMLSLTFIMMALGCLLFSLGSIGILFVLTGRRKINAIYTVLLIVAASIGIVVIVTTCMLRQKMGMMFRNIIKDSIKHYMRKNSYAAFVNTIQLQHKCCGADSVMDYTVSNLPVPVSCYPDKGTTPHNEGCAEILNAIVQRYLTYIISLLSAVLPMEIASMVCGILMLNKVKSIPWKTRFAHC